MKNKSKLLTQIIGLSLVFLLTNRLRLMVSIQNIWSIEHRKRNYPKNSNVFITVESKQRIEYQILLTMIYLNFEQNRTMFIFLKLNTCSKRLLTALERIACPGGHRDNRNNLSIGNSMMSIEKIPSNHKRRHNRNDCHHLVVDGQMKTDDIHFIHSPEDIININKIFSNWFIYHHCYYLKNFESFVQ